MVKVSAQRWWGSVVAAAAVVAGTVMLAPPAGAIVGGTTLAAGQAPYLVSVQRPGWSGGWGHSCGGAILDATTIVTAAHCVDGAAPTGVRVSYGSVKHAAGTIDAVAAVRVIPSYNSRTIANDIAVLKLATPIPLGDGNPDIGTVELPPAGSDPAGGTMVQVAGWGDTREGGSLSATAEAADLPIIDRRTCRQDYGTRDIDNSMVCAGLPAGGQDSCQGDSGGPMVEMVAGRPVLVGIVSWGRGCARANLPGVYARVGALLSWLKANTGATTSNTVQSGPNPAGAVAAEQSSAGLPGADHGCPADAVCLYRTAQEYRNGQPSVLDSQEVRGSSSVLAVGSGSYAEVVDNTRPIPQYSSEGTIALGVGGLCVYTPEDTDAPNTDNAMNSSSVNAIVVGPTRAAVDALTIACPAI